MYDEEYLVDIAKKAILAINDLGIYCRLDKTISKKGYASLDIIDGNNIVLFNIGYEKDNPFWSNKLWDYKTTDIDKIVKKVVDYKQSSEYYELVALTTK